MLLNAAMPNNSFTGRGRVTVNDPPPDGHAPVQCMFGVFARQHSCMLVEPRKFLNPHSPSIYNVNCPVLINRNVMCQTELAIIIPE